VSPRLLGRLDRIQDIVRGFTGRTLERVPVDATPADPSTGEATGAGTGSFHSCGVDSLYTAVRHREELSHLVFMQGFGPYEIDSPRGVARREHARALAREWDKEIVEFELDVHDVAVQYAPWHLAHGLVLASVGLTLQGALRRLYVPAGQEYRDLFPLLTHPLLDPLWSTESLEVVHDGCEATRFDKVKVLDGDATALDHLAVCNKPWAVVNCGGCEKCLRTMANLHLAGALERTATLPDTLSPRAVAGVPAVGAKGQANWRAPLLLAQQHGDRSLALAIRWATRPRPLLAVRHRLGRLRRRVTRRTR
jgi:hypothetical protein